MHNMLCKNGKSCCTLGMIAWILLVIGGINWGLVGLGGFLGQNWNFVYLLFGSIPELEWIIYILVGISAVMLLFGCKCEKCRV